MNRHADPPLRFGEFSTMISIAAVVLGTGHVAIGAYLHSPHDGTEPLRLATWGAIALAVFLAP